MFLAQRYILGVFIELIIKQPGRHSFDLECFDGLLGAFRGEKIVKRVNCPLFMPEPLQKLRLFAPQLEDVFVVHRSIQNSGKGAIPLFDQPWIS